MNTDLALAIGILAAVLSFPAIVSAFSEGRAPRFAIITMIVGVALAVWAYTAQPGGYVLSDVPRIYIELVARIF